MPYCGLRSSGSASVSIDWLSCRSDAKEVCMLVRKINAVDRLFTCLKDSRVAKMCDRVKVTLPRTDPTNLPPPTLYNNNESNESNESIGKHLIVSRSLIYS